ncbi:MAG: peptidylprolyl isomerase [Clostridiales bacterium]|jgi:cyclophilin family peptidyl-prolyl cis-trans isomerase|nr:peptidylprolyl isomerase [Clostridiales bacterium]
MKPSKALKTVFVLTLSFTLGALGIAGCAPKQTGEQAATKQTGGQSAPPAEKRDGSAEEELPQFSPLKEGETIVTMKTGLGDIKLRFFPEYAPKSVENFVKHAKDGYYDGLTFHRVVNEFVIQSGDPTGTGRGGESIYGDDFEVESTDKLHHFSGALGMARSDALNSVGSQFYIVCSHKLEQQVADALKDPSSLVLFQDQDGNNVTYKDYFFSEASQKYDPLFSDAVIAKYKEVGGRSDLDYNYTVFGQVIEGMDVVDKISAAETDENDKPLTDIIIQKMETSEYKPNETGANK